MRPQDRKRLGETLKRIASDNRLRGHATWFHGTNRFKATVEVAFVAEWAAVVCARHGWVITNVRKNPEEYPDCLADFRSDEKGCMDVIGVEMTELVDDEAIRAHQELRRLKQEGLLQEIDDDARLDFLNKMLPDWPHDKFMKHLQKTVSKKDLRSGDGRLKKQFLLTGIINHVIDPASLQVNRRARRAKTDRIDAISLLRALMAFHRGEDQVFSAVQVPSIEKEDARRVHRERERLIKERIQ